VRGTRRRGSPTARPPSGPPSSPAGLAYWRNVFELAGGSAGRRGTGPTAAVSRPAVRATVPPTGLITEQLRARLGEDTELPAAAAALAASRRAADLLELATTVRAGVPRLRQAAAHRPAARRGPRRTAGPVRWLPLLPAEWSCGHLRRALAGLMRHSYAVYASARAREPVPQAAPPTPEDLPDRAVAAGDGARDQADGGLLRCTLSHADPVLLHRRAGPVTCWR